ncbi:MAG: ABC transporter ATP-binding protein [Clostridiales bacterium]|nr:ABC transporter ATP-binding protein [Clostridiales bacterium]
MQNALELKNITKNHKDFTLDNVSFSLPKGCIMGFIGENGAGKSTTIRLILDIAKRDGGELSVLGETDISNNAAIKEHIGVVMDETNFPDTATARNINLIMKNIFRTWNEEVYHGYIKRFGLPLKKAIKDYSRGMKMKLAISVALSHDSKLLILDEATSGLDPIVRDEILDVFLDFIQDEEKSILMSSHIVSDLEKICDYITLIHSGKIIFSESKDQLMEKYSIVKCSQDQLEAIASSAIIGARHNKFGSEALVLRDHVPTGFVCDPPTLEEIMLYNIKGGK